MRAPNLANSVDAVALIRLPTPSGYRSFLLDEVSPAIRSMERRGSIIWFSFLVHNRETAGRMDLPPDIGDFLHARFGLPDDADPRGFMEGLPHPFIYPIVKSLGEIGGIDVSLMGGDWARAWWMVGESSDWVLKLVEAHSGQQQLPPVQMEQFLHFIENALQHSPTPFKPGRSAGEMIP